MRNKLHFGSGSNPGFSILGRFLATILGIGAFILSIFLGAIFLAIALGLIVIVGIGLVLRGWWLKRKLDQYNRDHGDLEAEYKEIDNSDDFDQR